MPKKRFSAEQIVVVLRQIEVLMSQGKATPGRQMEECVVSAPRLSARPSPRCAFGSYESQTAHKLALAFYPSLHLVLINAPNPAKSQSTVSKILSRQCREAIRDRSIVN